jgi:hypothetical protein
MCATPTVPPVVVSIDMGYGHLRAAYALAAKLKAEMLHADRAPLADQDEQRRWARVRRFWESISRSSQKPGMGGPLGAFLDAVTSIPRLHPYRDLSAPTLGVKSLSRLIQRGLGRGLQAYLQKTGAPLLTTFYAPAIAADQLGYERVYCVVTDSDINRVWAPFEPRQTRIHYLVPSWRAQRRLQAYGVPAQNIEFTGFPLPDELLGGPELPALRRNLAARMVRLDPDGSFSNSHQYEILHTLGALPTDQKRRPPLLVFAIGGSGAQVGLAERLINSLKDSILKGRMRLALVAGVRNEVAEQIRFWLDRNGLAGLLGSSVQLLVEKDFPTYYARFNQLLAETDILWTKPSEMTFYAALGIPMILSSPVGVHEWSNRRWAREHGAGLKQRDARFAAGWIDEWLSDGILAGAAWSGFMRLPKDGLYRIAGKFGPV